MIQSGKDFTNVVEAKRQQLTKPKKCDTAREIHNAINRRLTEIGRR